MAYRPKDLFLGVIDVFVLMLPGALLLGLAALAWAPTKALSPEVKPSAAAWIAFALGAYVVGHLVSGLGALLEDGLSESSLGKMRVSREREAHQELREGVRTILATRIARALVDEKHVRRWAAVLVHHAGGPGAADLARRDADRRFFRNATVVCGLAVLLNAAAVLWGGAPRGHGGHLLLGAALVVVGALSLLRYLDQDAKFSRDGYESLIALDAIGKLPARTAAAALPARVAQAGALVFRLEGGAPRYLLVRARKAPRRWIFPKGHLEAGETSAEAAMREAREEAGVAAAALAPLGVLEFDSGEEPVRVEYFLARFLGDVPSTEGREIRWCEFDAAVALLPFEDARTIVRTAERLLQGILDASRRE